MDSVSTRRCIGRSASVQARSSRSSYGLCSPHDSKERALSRWLKSMRCFAALLLLAHMGSQAMRIERHMRPITLVVGYAPGGLSDRLARVVAKYLEQEIDRPVVVKNVSGAGGVLAANEVLYAHVESPTLLVGDSALIVSHVTQAPQSVDLSLLLPIGTLGSTSFVVAVANPSKFRTLNDLLGNKTDSLKRLTVGTPGANTVHDLTARLMLDRAQTKAEMIHYRGGVPMLADLLEDRLSFGLLSLVTAREYERSQQIRILAVTGERRSRLFPNTPTVSESYSGLYSASTAYLLASPQMSDELKLTLTQKWGQIIRKTDFLNELRSLEMSAPFLDAAGAAVKITEEKKWWTKLVKIQPR